MTQFWIRERTRTFQFRKTSPSSSYRTFARGGYIMRMSPTAMGMEVVPSWVDSFRDWTAPGQRYPRPTPTPMAPKIQRVRYRSRKERRFATPASDGLLPADRFDMALMGFGKAET